MNKQQTAMQTQCRVHCARIEEKGSGYQFEDQLVPFCHLPFQHLERQLVDGDLKSMPFSQNEQLIGEIEVARRDEPFEESNIGQHTDGLH